MKRCCLLVAALALGVDCQAVGYFNMPTSPQQWLGVGFGPGYHAPMVLGPACGAPVAAQPVLRNRRRMSLPSMGFASPTCVGCDPISPAPIDGAWSPAGYLPSDAVLTPPPAGVGGFENVPVMPRSSFRQPPARR